MDTEESMKQNSKFVRELCCQEAENIVFCKILHIFSNSAQFTKFCKKFCNCIILGGLKAIMLTVDLY